MGAHGGNPLACASAQTKTRRAPAVPRRFNLPRPAYMPGDAGSGERQGFDRLQAGYRKVRTQTVLNCVRRLPRVSTFVMAKTQDCIRYEWLPVPLGV